MCENTCAHILFWTGYIIILIFLSLGAVAFITLLERKYLGLRQIRLGPNKVTLRGYLQPVADGVKLLIKQFLKRGLRQSLLFLASPLLLLLLFTGLWGLVLFWGGYNFSIKFSSLLFFSLLGVSTYAVILTGWSIIRTFAKLGRLRGILQSLSYEVALILVFLVALLFLSSFSLNYEIFRAPEHLVPWAVIWCVLSMMETNRAPFDLLEGERELIRGFNIEIGRLAFVFLFLREYGIIIVIATILSLVELGEVGGLAFFIRRLILIARSCYPRVRYDTLISTIWQMLLPVSVTIFYFCYIVY